MSSPAPEQPGSISSCKAVTEQSGEMRLCLQPGDICRDFCSPRACISPAPSTPRPDQRPPQSPATPHAPSTSWLRWGPSTGRRQVILVITKAPISGTHTPLSPSSWGQDQLLVPLQPFLSFQSGKVFVYFLFLFFFLKAEGGCRYKRSHLLQALPFLIPFQILHSLFSFSNQEKKKHSSSKTRHRERKQRFTSPSKANHATYYASHPFPVPAACKRRTA